MEHIFYIDDATALSPEISLSRKIAASAIDLVFTLISIQNDQALFMRQNIHDSAGVKRDDSMALWNQLMQISLLLQHD